MKGRIAYLIGGPYPDDRKTCSEIFGPEFQRMADWKKFLATNLLNSSVGSQLRSAPASQWSVRTFQAFYVACWLHHPVEKGTFLIDLTKLPPGRPSILHSAYEQNLKARRSSHLSGHGRSAGTGWKFLRGYDELLVQVEALGDNFQCLMLKSEGHQVSLKGAIPHAASYVQKRLTGAGAQASAALHAYSESNPRMVIGRAAENYSKKYEALLKWLNLSGGTMITIREVMWKLFWQVNFPPGQYLNYDWFCNSSNPALGQELRRYVAAARGRSAAAFTAGGKVTAGMLKELENMADILVRDNASIRPRVFHEVITTPDEIDESVRYFKQQIDHPIPVLALPRARSPRRRASGYRGF